MSNQSLPTISVKKADGSTVKMTLEEFRAYKAQKSMDPHAEQGTSVRPNEVVTPNISPLLEEPQQELVHNLPMVEQSQALTNATPTIVGDVRPIKKERKQEIPPHKEFEPPVKKQDFSSPLEEVLEEERPFVPPIATINKAALKPIAGLTPEKSKPDAQKILSSLIAEDRAQAQIISTVQKSSAKMPMHDVVAKPRSVGPVDEMMNFSLVDFRRLASAAPGCAEALMQKFTLLKAESYLLFLNGRAAWFKSPLYQMYLEVLEKSLVMNKKLSVILGSDPNSLKMEEVQEIAKVSQSLNF